MAPERRPYGANNVRHSFVEASTSNERELSAVIDRACDFTFQLGARHDAIDESVLQQEFTGLKSLGKFQFDRRLDRARPGESDQSLGFRNHDIPQ